MEDLLATANVRANVQVSSAGPDPLALEVVLRGKRDGGLLAFVINASPDTVTPTLTFPTEAAEATELISARALTTSQDRQRMTLTLELEPYSVQVLHLYTRARIEPMSTQYHPSSAVALPSP